MAIALSLLAILTAAFALRPDFVWDDLSGVFFSMLGRALTFSVAQALVSVLLATALALVVAFAVVRLAPRAQRVTIESLRALGITLFFAPTLVASLTYLKWSTHFDWLPKFGWLPIVLVHVSLNLFFLAHVFATVMRDEWRRGARLVDVSRVFGFTGLRFYVALWAKPLRQEFLRWAPLVFWWSFSSFTTVLVLGGGPRYSSPDVLLFYLIGSGDRPARLLVLAIAQVLIGLVAIRYATHHQRASSPATIAEEATLVGDHVPRTRGETWWGLMGMLIAVLGVVFWLPAVWQGLAALKLDAAVLPPLVVSLQILWRAFVIGVAVVILGFVFAKRVSRALSWTLVVSPMVLAGLLIQSEWFYVAGFNARLWLTALITVWVTLPVLALWVFSKHESLLAKSADLLRVFRPGGTFRARFLYLPVLGIPILCYFQILFLAVLGDVGIVSTVMGSAQPSLAQMIYAKTSAYQFDVAFALFGYLVLSVFPVWFLLVLLRRKNEVRGF